MKYYDIDYAPRRARAPVLALAVAAAVAVVAGAVVLQQQSVRIGASHAQANQLRLRLFGRAEPASTRSALTKEQVQAVNAAIGELNVPWASMLHALDSVRPDSVTVMHVEARPDSHSIVVTARADDIHPLVQFMSSLSHAAPFVSAVPLRQEVVSESGAPTSKQATFEVHWE